MSAEDIAIETIRIATREALVDAARGESLSDLIGVHRSVIKARLGKDYSRDDEGEAVRILAVALEDMLDDPPVSDEAIIDYITNVVR